MSQNLKIKKKLSKKDAGPPLQRSNRTVTIQMLTPNLSNSNSGSRVRDRNGMLSF